MITKVWHAGRKVYMRGTSYFATWDDAMVGLNPL